MLEIKNISKKFKSGVVLKNIDLKITKGEIISLLGESGSGKSTILNILAGFEKTDNGSCLYKKKIIFDDATFVEPQDRDIGFVFQNYALFPHLNVEENVLFGINDKTDSFQKETLVKLLNLVNMNDCRDKYPDQLSGGQQQRIAIARVLARNSELILFDEAFSSIDSALKLKLIGEIKDIIKKYKKTAIFVTHCPKEALLLSDKIAYIENGTIIQLDTPKNLYKNPASKSIANLFASDGFLFQSYEDILGP